MALELNGTTGVSLVQDGVVTAADLAAGAARANFGAGAVLQVVQGTLGSTTSTSTAGTWTASGLSVSITPSSSSSKILITASSPLRITSGTTIVRGGVRIKRNSTVIWNTTGTDEQFQIRNTPNELSVVIPSVILDSPSTTSSTTYSIEFIMHSSVVGTIDYFASSFGSYIVAQEIAA